MGYLDVDNEDEVRGNSPQDYINGYDNYKNLRSYAESRKEKETDSDNIDNNDTSADTSEESHSDVNNILEKKSDTTDASKNDVANDGNKAKGDNDFNTKVDRPNDVISNGVENAAAEAGEQVAEEVAKEAIEEAGKEVAKEAGKEVAKRVAVEAGKAALGAATGGIGALAIEAGSKLLNKNNAKFAVFVTVALILLPIIFLIVVVTILLSPMIFVIGGVSNAVEQVGENIEVVKRVTYQADVPSKQEFFDSLYEKYGIDEAYIYDNPFELFSETNTTNMEISKAIIDHAIDNCFRADGGYYEDFLFSENGFLNTIMTTYDVFFNGGKNGETYRSFLACQYPYTLAHPDGSYYTIEDYMHKDDENWSHRIPEDELNNDLNYAEILAVLSLNENLTSKTFTLNEYYDLLLEPEFRRYFAEVDYSNVWFYVGEDENKTYESQSLEGCISILRKELDDVSVRYTNSLEDEKTVLDKSFETEEEADLYVYYINPGSYEHYFYKEERGASTLQYTTTVSTPVEILPYLENGNYTVQTSYKGYDIYEIIPGEVKYQVYKTIPATSVNELTIEEYLSKHESTVYKILTARQFKEYYEGDADKKDEILNSLIKSYIKIEVWPYGLAQMYAVAGVNPYDACKNFPPTINLKMLDYYERRFRKIAYNVDFGVSYQEERPKTSRVHPDHPLNKESEFTTTTGRSCYSYVDSNLSLYADLLLSPEWDNENIIHESIIYTPTGASRILDFSDPSTKESYYICQLDYPNDYRGVSTTDTIKKSGCTDCCYVMCAQYLLRYKIPIVVISKQFVNEAQQFVSGGMIHSKTTDGFLDVFNLHQVRHDKTFNQTSVVSAINLGAPVIIHISSKWGTYYTGTRGHFIVIMGYDDENFYVLDPANKKQTQIPISAFTYAPIDSWRIVGDEANAIGDLISASREAARFAIIQNPMDEQTVDSEKLQEFMNYVAGTNVNLGNTENNPVIEFNTNSPNGISTIGEVDYNNYFPLLNN